MNGGVQFEAKVSGTDPWEPIAMEWLGWHALQALAGRGAACDFVVCTFRRGTLVPGGGGKSATRVWVRLRKETP